MLIQKKWNLPTKDLNQVPVGLSFVGGFKICSLKKKMAMLYMDISNNS